MTKTKLAAQYLNEFKDEVDDTELLVEMLDDHRWNLDRTFGAVRDRVWEIQIEPQTPLGRGIVEFVRSELSSFIEPGSRGAFRDACARAAKWLEKSRSAEDRADAKKLARKLKDWK